MKWHHREQMHHCKPPAEYPTARGEIARCACGTTYEAELQQINYVDEKNQPTYSIHRLGWRATKYGTLGYDKPAPVVRLFDDIADDSG